MIVGSQAGRPPGPDASRGLLLALVVVVPVLHLAHATGLRNTLAALISVWAFGLLIRSREYPPLFLPAVAWLVLSAGSSLWSPNAHATLKSVVTEIVLPFGLFWAGYLTCRTPAAFRALCAAVIFGMGMLALLTSLGYLTGLEARMEFEDRAGFIYYYPGPGVGSTLSVYALPFALLLLASEDRTWRSVGWAGIAFVLVTGLGSLNRIFWISAISALAAFYFWQWPRLDTLRRRALIFTLAGCTITGLALVAYLTEVRGSTALAKDSRLAAWQEWGGFAGNELLLGHGFGKRALREATQGKLPSDLLERDPHLRSHGHNVLLDIAIQLGLIGLGVFCILLISLGRVAYRARDPARLSAGAALVALVVAMLVKNMTDDFMDHAGVVAFWGYAGLLAGRLGRQEGDH